VRRARGIRNFLMYKEVPGCIYWGGDVREGNLKSSFGGAGQLRRRVLGVKWG